jgi:hypothetical protein
MVQHLPEMIGENHKKNINKDSRSSGADSNPGSSKYEAGVATRGSRCSVLTYPGSTRLEFRSGNRLGLWTVVFCGFPLSLK